MDFIEITKKNARYLAKGNQAIADIMDFVRSVYATFPESVQQKHHNLYESTLTKLSEARNDYVALGSYLLSDATLRMFTVKKEDEK